MLDYLPMASASGENSTDTGRLVGIILVVLSLLATGVLVLVEGGGDSSPGGADSAAAAAGEVFLEPTGSLGPDPFTANTDTDSQVDVPPPPPAAEAPTPAGTAGPPAATVPAGGTTPGLYGGTQSSSSCDRNQMIQFLTENPDKAAAWAGVQGIQPDQVPDFVRSLTPVQLTVDTMVLNHGFSNGAASQRVSVLQSGTAVLVDDQGVPRAKCACGNPLLEPPRTSPDATVQVVDDRPVWPTYQPVQVVVVRPDPPVTVIVIRDPVQRIGVERPVGTTGDQDSEVPDPGPFVIAGTGDAGDAGEDGVDGASGDTVESAVLGEIPVEPDPARFCQAVTAFQAALAADDAEQVTSLGRDTVRFAAPEDRDAVLLIAEGFAAALSDQNVPDGFEEALANPPAAIAACG